jgi:hypothetical protein
MATNENDSLSTIGAFQAEWHWTDDTAILHLAAFLNKKGLDSELADYLAAVAKEENGDLVTMD